MIPLKQSTAITVPFFAHDANGDGVTGIADGSWTKRISKNGGAFGAMSVTITEMENGWYSLPIGTGHSDTLGALAISLSATGAKRVNLLFRVGARLGDDLATQTSVDIVASILDDLHTTDLPAVKSDTGTLVTRVVGTLASGTHNPQSGDAYAIVNNGTYGNSAIKTAVDGVAAGVWAVGTRTLTSFGTLVADIWGYTTRLLTAGTNIVLAKGTGVTGFNDVSAADVNAQCDTAISDAAIPAGVWGVATRVLTAGTNIVLAKGTGITGFNDVSAADVNAQCDTAISDAALATAANLADLHTDVGNLPTAASIWSYATRLLTAGTNIVLAKGTGITGFNDVSAADVNAQCDTAISDAAIPAGVWGVGTRVLTAGTNIVLAKGTGITGFNDLDAAGVRGAVGLATANLDTQLAALPTDADVNAACDTAISDAALATAANLADVHTDLATVAGYIDTEVGAIKAKTDNLPASPAAVSDIPTATQNADALLKRDMSAVSGESARSPLNALRFLRNKWSLSGTTLTVTKEDDTTTAWTGTVATDAAAIPIISNDPS